MAEITDFQEKEAQPKLNFSSRGQSGTLVTSDTIKNDYLSELEGIDGQEQYFKMLISDSTIRKLYHAVTNPIRSATWSFTPANDTPEAIEAASLMEQIFFKDLEGGWKAKLDEILTFPWHGHAVFEKVHKNYMSSEFGEYTGLTALAYRDQRTLDKWKYNAKTQKLQEIHQLQQGDLEVNVWMPAETLVIFYNEKKGNDSGYPFCRMLYGNYKRKLLYKQLQAIGIEKGAIGVPILKLPKGVDPEDDAYADAQRQLDLYTQAENAYFILPPEYELELDQSNTFDPSKVQVAIKSENEEIAGSLVAMWLEMGIGGNSAVGSSTGESVEFFRDGIEYLADKVTETINLCLVTELMLANYGTLENSPKLTHSGIADEAGKELMEVVTGYVKDGVVNPDELLEDHIRKAHNLPAKMEGEVVENGETNGTNDDGNNGDNGAGDNSPSDTDDEIELSDKTKPKTPRTLINRQAPKISLDIKEAIEFSAGKYINDVMNRYKQLSPSKKQNATSKVKLAGVNNLKKDLKRSLTDTAVKAVDMARTEVPTASDVQLNDHERDMLRMVSKYGDDIKEIRLNEFSKLPAYIQVLITKQSDLISDASLTELRERLDFTFSSIETKSADENIIRQAMEDAATEFAESNQVRTKGVNAASLMVNEGREAFFFEPDVLDEIHSFTFMNIAPKSAICRELAGTTFNTNDVESLRYSPPLHHNCKSFLRANLKSSRGVDRLEVSKLAPSAKAQESITL